MGHIFYNYFTFLVTYKIHCIVTLIELKICPLVNKIIILIHVNP